MVKPKFSVDLMKDKIEKTLSDDKGEDQVTINLNGKSSLADYMIIVTGRSTKHVQSMANRLKEKLKKLAGHEITLEGFQRGEWILIDAGDVIVHIFLKDVRDFYNLEKIWCMETAEDNEMISSSKS